MQLEERLYQIGDFVFNQKYELRPSLPRKTKGYLSDGVFDGVSDDFGFGKPLLEKYIMSVVWKIADNDNLNLNWAILASKLVGAGKQPIFFSVVSDRYTAGDPIITYNYGSVVNLDRAYYERFKELKFDILLDSPNFFDCTNQVKFLDNSAIVPPANTYNSGKLFNTNLLYGTAPPYQTPSTMSVANIVNYFGELQENGLGQLYLTDQFFFPDGSWSAPTFVASNEYSKTFVTGDWFNASGIFQTSFVLNNLQLNGSLDNSCFVLQIDKTLNNGDWIEIINENNLTGTRFQNISGSTIYGLNFYNHANQTLYDLAGQKLNAGDVQFLKTIPNSSLDYLSFPKTINSLNTFYPSIKIFSNTNSATSLRIKNQRMYL